jgi:hypothetical protein
MEAKGHHGDSGGIVGDDLNGIGLPPASTDTSVTIADVTATASPVVNRSASTSILTVTLLVPVRIVLA